MVGSHAIIEDQGSAGGTTPEKARRRWKTIETCGGLRLTEWQNAFRVLAGGNQRGMGGEKT